MNNKLFSRLNIALAAAVLALGSVALFAAAPPAGTQIGNVATATYDDAAGNRQVVLSNTVYLMVQPVPSFILENPNTRTAAPGAQVSFPHVLTNTGNVTDTYSLAIVQLPDAFDLTNVQIFADVNGDGVPDNAIPITSTGPVPAGDSFSFVIVGTVPPTAGVPTTAQLRIFAASAANSVTAFNTDTVNTTNGAVISATKAVNPAAGPSPSLPGMPVTYTVSYTNNGKTAATDLRFFDYVPPGMTYRPGSGRWSSSGATELTDPAGGDPAGIDYSVTGHFVIVRIANVAVGQSGWFTFQTRVDPGLPPQVIPNVAQFSYRDGVNPDPVWGRTNAAEYTVTASAGVTFAGQTIAYAPQGGIVKFDNSLINTGSAADVFDITVNAPGNFPAGSTFTLVKSDNATPLLDTDGDGIPDTGVVAAGDVYDVWLWVQLPAGASLGGPYSVDKVARSSNDPTVLDPATDVLTTIIPTAVDVTNDTPVTGQTPFAPGETAGPEATPVTTIAINPGATGLFTLYINNTGLFPDSYNLSAAGNAAMTAPLPQGATVVFKNSANAVITNTGMVGSNGNALVYAEVTVPVVAPPTQAPAINNVYFRALSPVSGVFDIKLDAFTVNMLRSVIITPDNMGQASPGGTVVYTHTLRNNGNVLENDGLRSTINLSVTEAQPGFSTVLYWDDPSGTAPGLLDADDPTVVSVLGTNQYQLDPGEQATLFAVVYVSPAVAPGTTNTATVTAATVNGGGAGVDGYLSTAPPVDTAIDTTTVVPGDLTILKEQSLTGPAGPWTVTPLGAAPGAFIYYRLTVTNRGTVDATNVVVRDTIPNYTTYFSSNPAGMLTNGGVQWLLGTLAPGQTVVLEFRVSID